MFGSQVIEVAIGLFFIYTVLSLVCSTLREFFAGTMRSRARTLRDSICCIFADDPKSPSKATCAFFNHALIRGMTPPRQKSPSYISADTFAMTVLDMAVPHASLDNWDWATVRARLKSQVSTAEPPDPATPGVVEPASCALPAPMLRMLLVLMDQADGNIAAALQRIGAWYDDAMERLSGSYKRGSMLWIAVIATVVTVATNADTEAMVTKLWNEPLARSQVELLARDAVQNKTPIEADTAKLSGILVGYSDTELRT